MGWHRRTQLADYAEVTADLKKRSASDITAAEVIAIEKDFRKRIDTMIEHALPDAADLALRLTPANIQAMKEKFEDNDDKFRNEMMKGDTERQLNARYEKSLDRTEEWYGRFSRDQRAAIRKLSDARPMNNDFMLAERQRRERDFIDLLTRVQQQKPSRDVVIAQMKTYAEHFDFSPVPEERAFQEAYKRATMEMNAAIHNLTTPAQRARAASKLQDWIDTFNALQTKG